MATEYKLSYTASEINEKLGKMVVVNSDGKISSDKLPSIDYATLTNKPIKMTTITLSAANWTGVNSPYSQEVTMNGVTANSKLDLQPTPTQLVDLQNNDIALMMSNDNGTVTAYALNYKPTSDYTMQVLITEVEYI